jgi:hypothetical protein
LIAKWAAAEKVKIKKDLMMMVFKQVDENNKKRLETEDAAAKKERICGGAPREEKISAV